MSPLNCTEGLGGRLWRSEETQAEMVKFHTAQRGASPQPSNRRKYNRAG